MIFNDKKDKKVLLPVVKLEERSGASPSPVANPRASEEEAANQYAQPREEDGRLKNYAIYYRDRELARTKGDPMITMIQAYSQAEAQLEALKMQKDGCEILTIRSNEAVAHPIQDNPAALPTRPIAGPSPIKSGGPGSLFRPKHNLLRGF